LPKPRVSALRTCATSDRKPAVVHPRAATRAAAGLRRRTGAGVLRRDGDLSAPAPTWPERSRRAAFWRARLSQIFDAAAADQRPPSRFRRRGAAEPALTFVVKFHSRGQTLRKKPPTPLLDDRPLDQGKRLPPQRRDSGLSADALARHERRPMRAIAARGRASAIRRSAQRPDTAGADNAAITNKA